MKTKSLWLKCVACLLSIAVISGALLSVLYNVLEVTAAERTMRAIRKIYGEEKEYYAVLDTDAGDDPVIYDGMGEINKIYNVVEGSLLFQTTGYKGYKNGTITLWIQVVGTQNDALGAQPEFDIVKVLLEKFEKQTLMSKLSDAFYGNFTLQDVTKEFANGKLFSATDTTANYNPVTGATYSATAAANAVNCVMRYLAEKGADNEN